VNEEPLAASRSTPVEKEDNPAHGRGFSSGRVHRFDGVRAWSRSSSPQSADDHDNDHHDANHDHDDHDANHDHDDHDANQDTHDHDANHANHDAPTAAPR
jgi:hypothetical protein